MVVYLVSIDLPPSARAATGHSSVGLVARLDSALSGLAGGDVERIQLGSLTRRGARLLGVRVAVTVRAHDAGGALAAAMTVVREAIAAYEGDWDISEASATVTPAGR
jgi:hypothetical protein